MKNAQVHIQKELQGILIKEVNLYKREKQKLMLVSQHDICKLSYHSSLP